MASATGASSRHSGPSSREANNKIAQEAKVKPQAKRLESRPAGRWRFEVRRLRASIGASSRRLKAMAAERAETMATTIQRKRQPKPGIENPASRHASSAPVRANGRAKMECSNLIMSRVRRRRVQKRLMFTETLLFYRMPLGFPAFKLWIFGNYSIF